LFIDKRIENWTLWIRRSNILYTKTLNKCFNQYEYLTVLGI
jgi:hypothetical protein